MARPRKPRLHPDADAAMGAYIAAIAPTLWEEQNEFALQLAQAVVDLGPGKSATEYAARAGAIARNARRSGEKSAARRRRMAELGALVDRLILEGHDRTVAYGLAGAYGSARRAPSLFKQFAVVGRAPWEPPRKRVSVTKTAQKRRRRD